MVGLAMDSPEPLAQCTNDAEMLGRKAPTGPSAPRISSTTSVRCTGATLAILVERDLRCDGRRNHRSKVEQVVAQECVVVAGAHEASALQCRRQAVTDRIDVAAGEWLARDQVPVAADLVH